MHIFSFKKMHLKMSPGKWRPFCIGLNVLRCLVNYELPGHQQQTAGPLFEKEGGFFVQGSGKWSYYVFFIMWSNNLGSISISISLNVRSWRSQSVCMFRIFQLLWWWAIWQILVWYEHFYKSQMFKSLKPSDKMVYPILKWTLSNILDVFVWIKMFYITSLTIMKWTNILPWLLQVFDKKG